MKFTLAVTCMNEMDSIATWRSDIEKQTRQPDEIIIVDSESTDGTTEYLQGWAKENPILRIIVQKCSPAKGHNIANRNAAHDIIISTDMGVRIDSRWVEHIVMPFESNDEVDVVAGSYMTDLGSVITPAARAEYYLKGDYRPKYRDESKIVISNRSSAYRKKVWEAVNGLPEDLTRFTDDSVFGRQIVKMKFRIRFAPNALVYWSRHRKLGAFWKEVYGYGRGRGEAFLNPPTVFRYYKQGYMPRSIVPFVSGLMFLAHENFMAGVARALRKLDFVAILYMPLLIFGNGYFFGKGFIEGDMRGSIHCLECRRRLTQ